MLGSAALWGVFGFVLVVVRLVVFDYVILATEEGDHTWGRDGSHSWSDKSGYCYRLNIKSWILCCIYRKLGKSSVIHTKAVWSWFTEQVCPHLPTWWVPPRWWWAPQPAAGSSVPLPPLLLRLKKDFRGNRKLAFIKKTNTIENIYYSGTSFIRDR